jgi:hypothetical protein
VGTPPLTRPAFYALESGGWRDYVTLLHLPYTTWHLSYVAMGAFLAPDFAGRRLLAALTAFFLALGVGAHALDELNGRPLQTRIPSGILIALAAVSIAAATAIGVAAALAWTPWLLVFVVAGAFLVVAYNLELFGGAFHGDLWFGLAWGAFPLVTTYFVVAERLTDVAVLGALFAFVTSLAQRMLSTQVRDIRRRGVGDVGMLTAPEAALRLLGVAMLVLAATLLAVRL